MQQVRQSMNLLTTDYQIGHTSYEEGEHFLVFKRVGGGGAPCPVPPCSAAHGCVFIVFTKSSDIILYIIGMFIKPLFDCRRS